MIAISVAFIEGHLYWGRERSGFGILVHLFRVGEGNSAWRKKCCGKVTKVTLSLIILPRLDQVSKKRKGNSSFYVG